MVTHKVKKMKKNKSIKNQIFEIKKKSAGIAVLLSLLITGAGQMYAGRILRGFIFMFIQVALWFIALGWVMWIIAPIDAYYCVENHNKLVALELGINPQRVI